VLFVCRADARFGRDAVEVLPRLAVVVPIALHGDPFHDHIGSSAAAQRRDERPPGLVEFHRQHAIGLVKGDGIFDALAGCLQRR
jgi:hypothetical protein